MESVKDSGETEKAGDLVQDFSQHLALLYGTPQEINPEQRHQVIAHNR